MPIDMAHFDIPAVSPATTVQTTNWQPTSSQEDVYRYLAVDVPVWLDFARRKLESLLSLKDNWDGYGAARPRHMSASAAWELLFQIADPGTPIPSMVPTREGLVQLEWHQQGIDLEILLVSRSVFEYSFEDLRGEYETVEEKRISYDVTELKQVLQRLQRA